MFGSRSGGSFGYLVALACLWPLACDGESDPGSGGSGSGGAAAGGLGGQGASQGGTRAGGAAGHAGAGGSAAFAGVSSVAGSGSTSTSGGEHGSEGGAPGSSGAGGDSAGDDSAGGVAGAGTTGGSTGSGGSVGTGGAPGSGGAPIVLRAPVIGCPGRMGGQSGAGAGGAEGDGNAGHSAGGTAGAAQAPDALGEAGAGAASALEPPIEDDSGLGFVTTDLGSGVPVALNQLGQVVAVVAEQGACRSFLIDDHGVREIVVPGEHACTLVNDINDAGFVVGTFDKPPRPFLWHDGVATLLTEVSGTPVAINNSNQVVFDSGQLWEAGQVTELTVPGGALLTPRGMNNAGQIVGELVVPPYAAYLWEGGTALELPIRSPVAINDHGHVLCSSLDFETQGIWDGTRFLPRALPLEALAVALNDADEIAGTIEPGPGDFPPAPFVGVGTHFSELRGSGHAVGLNDRGDVIGQRFDGRRIGDPRSGPTYLSLTPGPGRIWSRTCSLACCSQDSEASL